ncbi:MAG: RNA polymerase sigma factor FliA, partial [Pseudomonadota bacterium]
MYSAQGQPDKDALVTRHAPLVKRIAHHLMGRLPSSVMVDDLIQAGMIGLLDAAGQYDQSQGASFETYASIRIRGAMIDELRRNDWAPKSVHRKARDLSAAIQAIEAATGRDAQDGEVAEAMGISLDEYHRILQDTASSRMASYDELTAEDNGGYDRFSNSMPAPDRALEDSEFREHLMEAIGTLPEREQLIMSLYYDQELNLKEIGAVLKVSESRISQLLSQAHSR